MRDFTLSAYRSLLLTFQQQGYCFLTFAQYCHAESLPERFVVLRHDVDKRADYSVQVAELEQALGAHASYYFRVVPESNRPDCIRAIAAMGHEVGYHYEDMALASGHVEEAYAHFCDTLAYFRGFYPVETICMHGAPASRYDGRDLWRRYSYKALGVVGEPYFDVDFSDVFYLTDTGRCWDGYKVSVRDKIPVHQDRWCAEGLRYHATSDLLRQLQSDALPRHIMLTTHPQRWTDAWLPWLVECVAQTLKNGVKRILILLRKGL